MNLFENITHIIFDLDGLLIDSEPLWQASEEVVLAEYGKAWDHDIARSHIGVRLDECAVIMVKAYGLDLEPKVLETRIMTRMFEMVVEKLVIMPGAHELIEQAHQAGLILAVASSSPENYIRHVVQAAGWSAYIQVMASGFNVPRGKPAPDVYLEAARMLQVEPHKAISFEDSINGAKAAQAAGLRCVAIPGHGFVPEDFAGIADWVLPSLTEVLPHLPH